MIIQNFGVYILPDGRLKVGWITMDKVQAIQVSIAEDIQFSKNIYNFLLPENAQDCVLDVGNGKWFVRVGAWVGDESIGVVKWSGGLGPIELKSEKTPKSHEDSTFRVSNTKAIENGFRLYCGGEEKVLVIEVSNTSDFQASATKTYFMKEAGMGFVNVHNIDPLQKYSIRYSMIKEAPKKTSFLIPTGVVIENVKSLPPSIRNYASEKAQLKSNKLLLQEVLAKPNMRFSSYAEYMKYVATREAN